MNVLKKSEKTQILVDILKRCGNLFLVAENKTKQNKTNTMGIPQSVIQRRKVKAAEFAQAKKVCAILENYVVSYNRYKLAATNETATESYEIAQNALFDVLDALKNGEFYQFRMPVKN